MKRKEPLILTTAMVPGPKYSSGTWPKAIRYLESAGPFEYQILRESTLYDDRQRFPLPLP